jgi:hypothetical protein
MRDALKEPAISLLNGRGFRAFLTLTLAFVFTVSVGGFRSPMNLLDCVGVQPAQNPLNLRIARVLRRRREVDLGACVARHTDRRQTADVFIDERQGPEFAIAAHLHEWAVSEPQWNAFDPAQLPDSSTLTPCGRLPLRC